MCIHIEYKRTNFFKNFYLRFYFFCIEKKFHGNSLRITDNIYIYESASARYGVKRKTLSVARASVCVAAPFSFLSLHPPKSRDEGYLEVE